MTIALTDLELHELFVEQGCLEYAREGYISKFDLPPQIGTGSDRWLEIRPGLEMAIADMKHHDLTIVEGIHELESPLSVKFFLSGGGRTVTPNVPGISDDYDDRRSCCYCWLC
jgi:AraC family transcriptional regulator, transcriptional activator of the genes for pyochelin and ferripyochelin receptors